MAYYKNDATLLVQQNGMSSMLGLMYDNAELNAIQTQTANADMDHLLKFNHMKSDAFTYAAGESVNLKFSQMGAIMKFSLSGLGGQTVKSLKLVADEEVLSTVGIQMSDQWRILSSSFQTLSFGDAGIPLGADETLTAYMMLGATELTYGKTITLLAETTTGGFYSATLNGGKLEAGKIYSLSKTMAERTFFGGGTGTEADPYQLTAAQHLKDLSDWINMETEGVYFQLQNDIDLTDKAWTPINKLDRKVTINIDGGGHTISNLTMNVSEGDASFIAYLYGGTIENLHFKNISVKNSSSGSYFTGGIVGYMNGSDIRIVGCSVSGSVEAVSGAGGFVGSLVKGTLAACLNMASVSGTSTCGGIIPTNSGTIIGCVNTGTVTVNGNSYQGAVVGYNHDNGTVTSCYWSGTDDTLIGIGNQSDSQQATKVTDWATFDFTTLNNAISTYGYKYVLNTDEATKTNEPLKLQKLETTGN